MIEVVIDSIRVSLISQNRVVMLRDAEGETQLPIWIGVWEAEAITIELQDNEVARPMTHDLLKNVIEDLGGTVDHIMINELRDGVYRALLYLKVDGDTMNIDCRPSDAIALAVRAKAPIYVEDSVMKEAGVEPEPDISEEDVEEEEAVETVEADPKLDAELDAFRDFLDNLDDE